jgi:hypothetical protein
MVKTLIALTLVGVLSGCATRPAFLENRVVCTVAKDKAFGVSQWGPLGITAEVSPKDAAVICREGN